MEVLNRLVRQRGAPEFLFADNGAEFTGHLVDRWAYHNRECIGQYRIGGMVKIPRLQAQSKIPSPNLIPTPVGRRPDRRGQIPSANGASLLVPWLFRDPQHSGQICSDILRRSRHTNGLPRMPKFAKLAASKPSELMTRTSPTSSRTGRRALLDSRRVPLWRVMYFLRPVTTRFSRSVALLWAIFGQGVLGPTPQLHR